ncbi:MAG: LEPR-XLL domain-containing protein, partial [Verrucomicrobiales bacterium]|nr:LEPR-XLL domain-containing protein [Verrucomicrobiales bacterium]
MKRQTRPSAASRTPRSLSETQIEALEPRILFSGAPVEAPEAPQPPAETATSPEQPGLIGEATGSDQEDAPTVSGTTPVALVETGAASGSLNAATLEAIAAAARQRWIESGLSAEQVAALDAVRYEIADLGGNHLGKANGYTITIDDDAAGSGAWFVDATPLVDEEFAASGMALAGGGAVGAYDLLSTLLHEQGHVLGLGDLSGSRVDVMGGTLTTGLRRLPGDFQALGATPGSIMGDAYLDPDWSQKGGDIDGEAAGDQSGVSIAMSADGNTVAIGAPLNNGNGSAAGHVRVYQWNGTTWVQRGSDIDGEALSDVSASSLDLSSDGTILAIGAPQNDGNGTNAGHVRVYVWNGTNWVRRGTDIDGEATGDFAGLSVALSSGGDILAVGAYQNDGNGTDSGHVRVFVWNGTAWSQRGADINGEAGADQFGISVALSDDGNTLAVGASQNDGSGSNAGHVRVFHWNGSGWTQRGTDINGEAANDRSGIAVSLSSDGGILAVGASLNDGGGAESGHIRIFTWNGSAWAQRGSDIDGEASGDRFGISVALSSDGNTVIGGANFNSGGGMNSGHARVYRWNGSVWSQLGSDLNGEAANNLFGRSVAISQSGDAIAVGGNGNQGINGPTSGHVRIFQMGGTGNGPGGIGSTTSVALDPNGNLLITDTDGGDTDDTLTLVVNGASYRITDATNRLSAGAGAVQIDDHTVEVAIASVTGADGIVFDTLGGDDRVTVDLSGGAITHAIDYRAGAGSGDALAFAGTAGTAAFTFSDLQSGDVVINGGPQIAYSGLDQGIDAGLAVASLTLIYGNASETITIADDTAAGWMSVTSSEAQAIRFLNPTQSLQVRGGAGDDTVSAAGFDAAFAGDLLIDGESGEDLVNLDAGYSLATDRSLTVTSESILGSAGAVYVASGTGNIALEATVQIVLVESALTVQDGLLSLSTNQFDYAGPSSPPYVDAGVKLDLATLTVTGSGMADLYGSGVFDNAGVSILNGSQIVGTGDVGIYGESGADAGVYIDGSTIDTSTAGGGHVSIAGQWAGIAGIWVEDASLLAGGNLDLEGMDSSFGIWVGPSSGLDAWGTVTLQGTGYETGVYFSGHVGELGIGSAMNQGVVIEGGSNDTGSSPAWQETAGVTIEGSVSSSGSITVTGTGGKAGISSGYGGMMLDTNSGGFGGDITVTGSGTERGVDLGDDSRLWSGGKLTLEGVGGDVGVDLGMNGFLSATQGDLMITGTATDGVGISAGAGTDLGAMGSAVEIRGEVTATGTGVAFDRVSVNDAVGTSASVTIVGTGGNAAMNRGVEMLGGLIIGSNVWLSGSATGETGLFLEDVEIHSGHGGPADLTLEGEGGHEGVHLGESSYLVSGRDLTIIGTAANGVGVSAGMNTKIGAMGTLVE